MPRASPKKSKAKIHCVTCLFDGSLLAVYFFKIFSFVKISWKIKYHNKWFSLDEHFHSYCFYDSIKFPRNGRKFILSNHKASYTVKRHKCSFFFKKNCSNKLGSCKRRCLNNIHLLVSTCIWCCDQYHP